MLFLSAASADCRESAVTTHLEAAAAALFTEFETVAKTEVSRLAFHVLVGDPWRRP